MSGQLGVCDGSASGIAGANKPHPRWPGCKNWRPIEPPTEMTSLREIKDKLDAIQMALISPDGLFSYRQRIEKKLDALAESQGKLLARLDALDAGLHETAMRNHQQVLARLMEIRLDTNLKWSPVRPPRKASKKARRRQER